MDEMNNNLIESYYCLTSRGRELFYIPYVFYAHTSYSRLIYRYSPGILKHIALLIKNDELNHDKLCSKGWEVISVYVPVGLVAKFIDACFINKKKDIKKGAKNLCNFISEEVNDIIERFNEGGNDDFYWQNEDEWWENYE